MSLQIDKTSGGSNNITTEVVTVSRSRRVVVSRPSMLYRMIAGLSSLKLNLNIDVIPRLWLQLV